MPALMRTAILLLFSACIFQIVAAQDLAPGQFFSAPLTLNPAMTGLINTDLRVGANYGVNWISSSPNPNHKINFNADMPILKGKLPKGDAIGIGILYKYENQDNFYSPFYYKLRENKAGVSVAYHKGFGKARKHHLSFGVQGIHVSDYSQDYYTEQYSTTLYREYNLGIMYSGPLSNKLGFTGGVAHHTEGASHSSGHNTIFVGINIEISNNAQLFINAIDYSYSGWYLLQVSSYARLLITPHEKGTKKDGLAVYCGGIYKHENSVAPYVGLEAKSIRFGISYNIRTVPFVTDLVPLGGYEVSLIYIGKLGLKPNANWHCPTMY